MAFLRSDPSSAIAPRPSSHVGRTATQRRRTLRVFGTTLVAAAISLFVLVPLLWVISSALKTQRELITNPLGLPTVAQWGNLSRAWVDGHFGVFFWNSVIVAVPTVLLVVGLSVLAAYGFSIVRFPGQGMLYALFIVGLTVPLTILVIPLFYQLLAMGIFNSYWALILPQVAKTVPFGIVLLRGFMDGFPKELLDASRIDGCSRFRTLISIVLPLSGPAVTSLLVLSFMWTWNQFILPQVLIRDEALRTLPLGLNYFRGTFGSNMPLLLSGSAISFIPVIVVYVIFQRHFVKGLTAGAIK